MNSLERYTAYRLREPMDRPLRRADFTPDLRKRLEARAGTQDLAKHYNMNNFSYVGPVKPAGWKPPDYSVYHPNLPQGAYIDGIGVGHKPGGVYHFTEYLSPLRAATSIEQLQSYPIPDCADWTEDGMAEKVAELHKQGHIVAALVGHIYENAWQVRGYQEFLVDMAVQPEWCDVMLDKFMRRNMKIACAGARAGVDFLLCGDDVANQNALMFSPESWRRFMKPRWAAVWAAARSIKPDIQIWYHSDGNIEAIIDELIEIGMTILNPLQPECMDLKRIRKRYAGKILFDGAIGTQSVMPFGKPRDVERAVRDMVELFGQDLFLSPTHVLEPEVPIENVEAFFATCDSIRFPAGGPHKSARRRRVR